MNSIHERLLGFILKPDGTPHAYNCRVDALTSAGYIDYINDLVGVQYTNIPIKQKLKIIVNGGPPLCMCGNVCEFGKEKFKLYCSKKCSTTFTKKKQYATNIERYGVACAAASDTIKNKIKKTNVERYGGAPAKSAAVRQKMKETNVKRHNVEYPSQSTIVRQKIKDSLLLKYGVDNPMKSDKIQQKAINTNIEKYGVPCVLQDNTIKEKIQQTNLKKYGSKNVSQTHIPDDVALILNDPNWWATVTNIIPVYMKYSEFVSRTYMQLRAKQFAPHLLNVSGVTIPHQTILDIIPSDVQYVINDRSVLHPKELDIYFPTHNFAIEINGVFWHSELSGQKDKKYHVDKYNQCQQKGIDLYQFWDFEITEKFDIVKSMILNKLGRSERIYARQTKVIFTDNCNTLKTFFDENHLQGFRSGKLGISLEKDGEVVAAAIFGIPRYNKKIDYELIRFASKKEITVVGGFSKILKQVADKSIISYANKRWSAGNVYKKNNFELTDSGTPSQYYTIDYKTLHNRVNFQKHKLVNILETYDNSLSAWNNIKLNGWDRIWDCGSSTWVYYPKSTE